MQESQIATQEQAKVESESKYSVKITGLLLMNGFVNTRAVDMAGDTYVGAAWLWKHRRRRQTDGAWFRRTRPAPVWR